MAKKIQGRKILALALAMVMVLLPMGKIVRAEKLNQPVYAYGESLTDKQIKETAKLLGVPANPDSDLITMKVNIDELNGLLHDNYHYYQVYSSVYLEPTDKVDGVEVEIATPKTITTITANQYANAAITAGAVNMKITVASVKAVDGSGALAGVYKAFKGTSGELSEDKVKVAQKELEVTSQISKENEKKSDFSDDQLNAAIAEIKGQISNFKNENNGTINGDQIGQIINNVVNNYNLNGILTKDNIQEIQSLMDQFSQIELTQDQKDALSRFGNKLVSEGGKLLENVKSSWDDLSPETKDDAVGFFQSIINGIVRFFQGLFS